MLRVKDYNSNCIGTHKGTYGKSQILKNKIKLWMKQEIKH